MFPEFGQSPLCLELDLDSYDGSWTHVAAFRGRGGWLMAARATIQSQHDLMRAVLLAACDDYENPIPAWRAEHLLSCDWSNLAECRELPPDLLDELLCEEEGAFFARWQRDTNGELVALHERAQHELAVLDARSAGIEREAGRQIAELQRRRRLADATPDQRAALTHLIAAIEADSDAAIAEAASRRTALRREVDVAEEALWERGDVLVEVEPMWCIRWQAAKVRHVSPSTTPRTDWDDSAAFLKPHHGVTASLSAAMRAARYAVVTTRAPQQPAALPPVKDVPRAVPPAEVGVSEPVAIRSRKEPASIAPCHPAASTPVAPCRQAAPVVEATPPQASHSASDGAPFRPSADPLAAKHRERRSLQLHLETTLAAGAHLRAGSPKFRRHHENVGAIRQRIAALDAALGGRPPDPTRELLAQDRAIFAAELAAHEKRGALAGQGAHRFFLYATRRQELLSKIARLDRQLAPAPKAPAAPSATGLNPALLETLDAERAQLAADLEQHERGGVPSPDDARARVRFHARQAELTARLARADAKLAHARSVTKASG